MAKFPKEIWDGRTSTRNSLDAVRPPDHSDWLFLINELQAMQEYLLNLADNVEVMPNLREEMEAAKLQMQQLKQQLKQLVPPLDLTAELAQLKEAVEASDVKDSHLRLKSGVQKLFLRTRALERGYKELKESVFYQLEVLANNFRNQLAALRKEMEARDRAMLDQIMELQDVLQNPDLGD